MSDTTDKYIAIKVVGIKHWFWFDRELTTRSNGKFTGKAGWGLAGAHTSITVPERLIEAEITSTELQYRAGYQG